MDQNKMGKFIKELREEKGLTQKDIGDKLHITDNSVSKWERGINAPDIYYLGPLSEMLGVTVKELLNGERKTPRKKKKEENRKAILEVKKLSKKFGNKKIINNIDMVIYEGDVVGLIGPNGAGKSTFIKAVIFKFLAPDKCSYKSGLSMMHPTFFMAVSKSLSTFKPQIAILPLFCL